MARKTCLSLTVNKAGTAPLAERIDTHSEPRKDGGSDIESARKTRKDSNSAGADQSSERTATPS